MEAAVAGNGGLVPAGKQEEITEAVEQQRAVCLALIAEAQSKMPS
jgi:hypothetical protein